MSTMTAIPRGRRVALAVLVAGASMTIVDETIVSVALVRIQRDLAFTTADLPWVVNAYLIAFGGLLLLAGRLGDLLGRRRVLLAGLGLFVAASAACGLAPSPGVLVAARFAQGAGGALVSAVALGMLIALFEEPRARARAIALYAAVGASGASIGLVAGGLITSALGWRWAFFVNVPVGLVALAAGRAVLPGGGERRGGVDVAGAALVVAGLMLAVFAIVGAEGHGWGSTRTLGLGAVALGLLAGFVARQATAPRPLMPLGVLRPPAVAAANVIQALLVAAMFGFQFLVALYFQRVLGYGPARAGLAVAPIAATIGLTSLVLFPRVGAGPVAAARVLVPGLLALAAGLLLLARAPVDGVYVRDVLPSAVLFGVGGGLALPALVTLATSAATDGDAGLVSGLLTTSQQVGGALGLSVLATLAARHSAALGDAGAAPAAALVGGFHLAWTVGGALLVVAALVAAVVLRPRPSRRAARPGAGTVGECS